MMNVLRLLAVGLLLADRVTAVAQTLDEKLIDPWLLQGPAQSTSMAPAPIYEELVAQLKSGDTAIDFTQLRFARTRVPNYDPGVGVPDALRAEMTQAMAANDLDKVVAVANQILVGHYTDVLAHVALGTVYERRGERARSVFERSVATGLLRSIATSGQGTLELPYVAISVDEPYNYLLATGHRIVSQDHVLRGNDVDIDAFEVIDPAGERKTVHFDMKLSEGAALRRLLDSLRNLQ